MSDIQLHDQSDPFTPAERQRLLDVLARWQPQAAWLFGSRTRNEATVESDVDLLIVDERAGGKDGVELDISVDLLPRAWHLDILALQPGQLDSELAKPNPFIREIVTRGELLYGQP